MKKLKLILIALTIVTLSLVCFTACVFLPNIGVDSLFDEAEDLFEDLFGINSYSPYEECKKGNHQWYYSWSEEGWCDREGVDFYNCKVCGTQKREVGKKLEHVINKNSGYEASCYGYGYTSSSWCERCGQILEEGYEIPPTGHRYTEIQNKREVTCTRDGYTGDEVCLDCGETISWGYTIYSNGHPNTYLINVVEPDCYNSGYSGDEVCSDCGEILWYGYTTNPCHNNITIINQVDATCSEDGYSGDEFCTDCNQIIYYGYTTSAFGHSSWEYHFGQDATCTEDGYTGGYFCIDCETYFEGHEIIPGGHIEYVYSEGWEGDCYNAGHTDEIWCERCYSYVRGGEEIPAGHKEVILPAVEPTCCSYGYTEGSVCETCGEVLVEQERTAMLKHENIVDVSGYDATCTANGRTNGKMCADCGTPTVTQHTIRATGHIFGDNGKCYSCDLVVTDCLDYYLNGYEDGYVVSGFASGYGDDISVLVIPSTYNGLPVTSITDYAFDGCYNLTKVVIPKTVTFINYYAFNGCSSLKTVEFLDYEQYFEINYTNWLGDCKDVEIKVSNYYAMTPYEVYLAAMNAISHNYNRYTMTSDGVTYMNYYGEEYPALTTYMMQQQYYNDFYIYKSTTDHMSSYNNVTKEEMYFVGEFLYLPDYYYKWYCSPEAFGNMFLIDSGDVGELTEKFFKNASFIVDEDGYMYLTLEMDEELIAALISEVGGISADWTVSKATYSYKFDPDGYIVYYTSDMDYAISGLEYTFRAVSTTSFSDVETLNDIYVPNQYYYTDYSYTLASQCNYVHEVVECPGFPATCFGNGKSAYSYCSRCYCAIESCDIIYAEHNYVNGECTECGDIGGYTEGLAYVLNEDGTGYILVGVGDLAGETTVYVPQQVYGRPVVSVEADAFDNTDVYYINIGNGYWYIDEFYGCDDTTDYWWNWD